jgi:hypothetical protein
MVPETQPTAAPLPARVPRHAGLALAVAATFALEGCLDPPPQYSTTDQYPPVVQGAMVDPSPVRIIYTTASEVLFTIPFRSVDVGEALQAAFVYDFDPTNPSVALARVPVPADPRPFWEQDGRDVKWAWRLSPRPTGCHTITMILSHASNFSDLYQTIDPLDVAQVTWFFNIGDPNSPAPSLDGCPTTGAPTAVQP